jgi:hypothetical protein
MDYTRFEIMGISSSKTIQIRIEAAHTSPMRRQRTTYHSPLLSVEECGELIKKLKSAINAARGKPERRPKRRSPREPERRPKQRSPRESEDLPLARLLWPDATK